MPSGGNSKKQSKAEALTTTQDAERILVPFFSVPMTRRRQTAAVLLWMLLSPLSLLCTLGAIWLAARIVYFAVDAAQTWATDRSLPSAVSLSLNVVLLCIVLWAMVLYGSTLVFGSSACLTRFIVRSQGSDLLPVEMRGGTRQWIRESRFFKSFCCHFASYFPSTIVFDSNPDGSPCTAEERFAYFDQHLPPAGGGDEHCAYLLCCHPHGLFGMGIWTAFVANTDISEGHRALQRMLTCREGTQRPRPKAVTTKGAGARDTASTAPKGTSWTASIHTMKVNFRFPCWRDLLLSIGFRDVTRETLVHTLTQPTANADHPGTKKVHLACLVPGGAAESIDCDVPKLTLANRKGFIKLAIQTQCAVVPVYIFGETELYRNLGSSRVRAVLRKLQKLIGIGTPLVIGRGIFNYAFGALPHRRQLTTVIGRPMRFPPRPATGAALAGDGSVDAAYVDECHQQYVAALCDLYRRYQPVYDPQSPYKNLTIA